MLTDFSLHIRSSILAAARLGIFIVLPAATFRICTLVCVLYKDRMSLSTSVLYHPIKNPGFLIQGPCRFMEAATFT